MSLHLVKLSLTSMLRIHPHCCAAYQKLHLPILTLGFVHLPNRHYTVKCVKQTNTTLSASTTNYFDISDHPRMQHSHCRLLSSSGSKTESTQSTHSPKSFYARLKEAPASSLYLGYAGLIPFVAPALFCVGTLSYSPLLAVIQVTYGAVVLSYLGGIQWGYSLDHWAMSSNWKNLLYSVAPPVVAWVGLLVTPEFGTLMLMTGFALTWRWDMKNKATPSWYRALRVCLSVGAIVSLGLTYTLGLLYPPPDTSTTYNWVKLIKIIKIILED